MPSRPFVHLHCHSHYSLLDGASKIPTSSDASKALGMPALAITDHGNLYGAVEFLREAKANDFQAIVGIEAYVAPAGGPSKTGGGASGQEHAFHLTLLARTGEGVRNLMRLSSKSFLEGFYYKPRIDKEILERHSEGLICLSGCASAEFSDLHSARQDGRGRTALRLVSTGFRRGELLRRDPEQRRRHPAATAKKARSTSPGGWACRSSPPATPTTSPGRTPPRTTSCSASTPARRSTTRTG